MSLLNVSAIPIRLHSLFRSSVPKISLAEQSRACEITFHHHDTKRAERPLESPLEGRFSPV